MSLIGKIETQIVMKKLLKFGSQAFSKNALLHTLWMLVYSAAIGAAEPFIQNWIQGNPDPTPHVIIVTIVKAVVIALAAYVTKNGVNGGSGTPVSATTQKVINGKSS